MSSLTDYFKKKEYVPKYNLGDRVYGIHEGIPFTGSVYLDGRLYENQPPRVMIHLYLPIKVNDQYLSIISTTHDKIQPLVELDQIGKKKNVRNAMAK